MSLAMTLDRESPLNDRLKNWGRWLRVWARAGRTPSLEGNYRSPQRNHWMEAPEAPRLPPPEQEDAWDVEIACRIIPLRYHLVLKLIHEGGLRPYKRDEVLSICNTVRRNLKYNIAPNDLQATIGMAESLLVEALELPAAIRKGRAAAWVQSKIPRVVE